MRCGDYRRPQAYTRGERSQRLLTRAEIALKFGLSQLIKCNHLQRITFSTGTEISNGDNVMGEVAGWLKKRFKKEQGREVDVEVLREKQKDKRPHSDMPAHEARRRNDGNSKDIWGGYEYGHGEVDDGDMVGDSGTNDFSEEPSEEYKEEFEGDCYDDFYHAGYDSYEVD